MSNSANRPGARPAGAWPDCSGYSRGHAFLWSPCRSLLSSRMSPLPAISPIPIVTSIAPLLGGVQAWVCDVWGVIHNGLVAFPPAVDACVRFRERGGAVLLLTNAPRPAGPIL